MEWRCFCATIEEYQKLIDQWKKSKDINENSEMTANTTPSTEVCAGCSSPGSKRSA
ncbi:hypothetical protein BDZ91DRAFT_739647, partial [Kalaharituber pfeilii]